MMVNMQVYEKHNQLSAMLRVWLRITLWQVLLFRLSSWFTLA